VNPCTVADHEEFLAGLLSDSDMDDLILLDPHECHAPTRRSDREVAVLLSILDSLEQGKEITQ
jgi:hypothetical protein